MTFTTGAAASALGLSPISVKLYCRRYGVGVKHGRDWLLTEADIAIIRDRRRGRRVKDGGTDATP